MNKQIDGLEKMNKANEAKECMLSQSETGVANDSFMLERANEHIQKLEQELKNKTGEYFAVCEKMTYYRTMLMKILDL